MKKSIMQFCFLFIVSTTQAQSYGQLPDYYTPRTLKFTATHRNQKFSEIRQVILDEDDLDFYFSSDCDLNPKTEKNCAAVKNLFKTHPFFHADKKSEPSKQRCEKAHGIVETIFFVINGQKHDSDRCIFPKDHSFISMDLIRSFNGKEFITETKDRKKPFD